MAFHKMPRSQSGRFALGVEVANVFSGLFSKWNPVPNAPTWKPW